MSLNLIDNISIFENILSKSKGYFIKVAQEKTFKRNEVLFNYGDNANYFYVIVKGWIKIHRVTLDGEEVILDILNSNSIFGEESINNHNYGYSAEIITDTKLFIFPISLLRECLEVDQILARNLLKHAHLKQDVKNKEIEHLTLQSSEQKIGCFLLRLCKDGEHSNITLHLPYDKCLIAARLGMKSETFSRSLAKLQQNTGIKVKGSIVYIDNVDQLSSYVCNACSDEFPCS